MSNATNKYMLVAAYFVAVSLPQQASAFAPSRHHVSIRRQTSSASTKAMLRNKHEVEESRCRSDIPHATEQILQTCKTVVTGAAAAAALFVLNPTIDGRVDLPGGPAAAHVRTTDSSTDLPSAYSAGAGWQGRLPAAARVRLFQPRAANAVDEIASSDAPTTSVLDDSLPSPDAIGTMSSPTDASSLSPLKLEQRNSVLDEAWRLVDKYYIDRSFNGQDWNEVRDRYEDKMGSKPNDDKVMSLTTEMIKSLGDKYSRVLDRKSYAQIQKFDLIGVGATLMPDGNKKLIVGAPPIPGSAAEEAGLLVGDFIDAVNGISTDGRTAFDIIDQIGENPNAKEITMTVRTQGANDLAGEGKVRDVTMQRQFAEVKDPVSFKITERREDGTNVGYIRISEFNSLVKPSLEAAIKALEDDGANAFVLDLRSNPGGAFQSAVEIAGLFMKDRVATSVVDSNQVELPFKTPSDKMMVPTLDPVVIWIDGGSASATEVLAGALHDQCRAVIMGQKSFGKGLIQAVYGLKNGSGLVLTVAKYVTPAGTDIQGVGINPDITGNGVPGNLMSLIMSTDTSRVDFNDIKERLGPSMCKAPDQ